MAEKRRDKKGRILRKGESPRTGGRYMYRYMDCSGEYQTVYSWRLVKTYHFQIAPLTHSNRLRQGHLKTYN